MSYPNVISIRPHHGMCLAYFEGKGYSDVFTSHMQSILDQLETGLNVKLCVHTDAICSACPHNQNECCENRKRVESYDRKVLEFCELSEGEELEFDIFVQKVEKHILSSGRREEICGRCRWNTICSQKQSRWEIYNS